MAHYPVDFEMVTYKKGDELGKGLFSRPVGRKKAPGLILLSEFWGLTDVIKHTANEFASLGYATLAPDLYAGRICTNRDDAGKVAVELMDQATRMNSLFDSAVKYLQSRDFVAGDKIAVMGYCLGGTLSLRFGCHSSELAACVVYYGGNPKPISEVEKLRCPFLGVYGETDPHFPPSVPQELEAALKEYSKKYEVHIYKAGHAFCNNTREGYDKTVEEQAWKDTLAFFGRTIGN